MTAHNSSNFIDHTVQNTVQNSIQDVVLDTHVSTENTVQAQSWFESLKEKFNLESLRNKFDLSSEHLLLMALYLGMGFITGFLFRRYGTYLFILGLLVIALVGLTYVEVVSLSINWSKVYSLFGIDHVGSPDSTLLNMYWAWIKSHVVLVVSFVIGFLIGNRIG